MPISVNNARGGVVSRGNMSRAVIVMCVNGANWCDCYMLGSYVVLLVSELMNNAILLLCELICHVVSLLCVLICKFIIAM